MNARTSPGDPVAKTTFQCREVCVLSPVGMLGSHMLQGQKKKKKKKKTRT